MSRLDLILIVLFTALESRSLINHGRNLRHLKQIRAAQRQCVGAQAKTGCDVLFPTPRLERAFGSAWEATRHTAERFDAAAPSGAFARRSS